MQIVFIVDGKFRSQGRDHNCRKTMDGGLEESERGVMVTCRQAGDKSSDRVTNKRFAAPGVMGREKAVIFNIHDPYAEDKYTHELPGARQGP